MACRQCTRPSPARVAISRIEKAWLREAIWRCAPFCAQSKQDRGLVTEPVNDTKLASLSVIEQE